MEEMVIVRPWQGIFLRFLGFVLGSVPVFIVLFGMFPHVPLVGFVAISVIVGLVSFPHLFGNFFGATKNYPRVFLGLSLLPALLFSFVLFIADTPTEPTAPAPAPAPARPSTPTPMPSFVARADPEKEEKVLWSASILQNKTSKVLLGVTVSCDSYYQNKKLAGSVKNKLNFEDDLLNVPMLPNENREFKPDFKISGNKDDVDESLTECKISNEKFAKEDKNLPVKIELFNRKNKNYGNYNTSATIKNTSGKELKLGKLAMACVIINEWTKSDEQILDEIKYGIYKENSTRLRSGTYYSLVIARAPGTSDGETKLDIPANGEVVVRLYKKGGMFSADEELGTTPSFTQYKCWVID